MISIYNAKESKSGYRVEKEQMNGMHFMHDPYLAVLINRLGGEVVFTEEELKQVQHLDYYFEDSENSIIAKMRVNSSVKGSEGDVLNKIYTATNYSNKRCVWSFHQEEDEPESLVFVPEHLKEDEKVNFITSYLESLKEYEVTYSKSKPTYELLKGLYDGDKLDSWDRDKLEKLEQAYFPKEIEPPVRPTIKERILNLFSSE